MMVGAIALGGMLSVMTLRWQAEAFPESGPRSAATTTSQGGTVTTASSQDVAQGKTLFESKCASCHSSSSVMAVVRIDGGDEEGVRADYDAFKVEMKVAL
jgi:cytochrome c5